MKNSDLSQLFGVRCFGLKADAPLVLELANEAVALQDGFAQAHSALALAYSSIGRHDEPVAVANRALELAPGDADTYNFGALTFIFAGHSEEVVAASTKAIRIDPQHVFGGFFNGLGCGCFIAGMYEEAIDAFAHNAEQGGPLAAPALTFWTASCVEAGRIEDAGNAARLLLDFFPEFSISRY